MKKKFRKIISIMICIFSLFAFASCGKKSLNSLRKSGTGKEYLKAVVEKSIDTSVEKSSLLSKNWAYYYSTKARTTGNLSLNISPEILNMLSMYLDIGDFTFINDIKFKTDIQLNEYLEKMNINFNVGDSSIFTLDFIMNILNGEFFVSIPEAINKTLYLKVPEEDFNDYLLLIDSLNKLETFPIYTQEFTTLSKKYVNIILDNIDEINKVSETLSLPSISENIVSLEFDVTEKKFFEIAKTLIQTASTDEMLKDLINKYQEYFTVLYNSLKDSLELYEEMPNLYEEFLSILNDLLYTIESNLIYATDDYPLNCILYVDDEHTFTGIQLGEKDSTDDYDKIKVLKAENQDKFEFLFSFEDIKVEGSGNYLNKSVSAEYNLTIDDSIFVSFGYENFNKDGIFDGNLTGKFFILPKEGFYYLINDSFEEFEDYSFLIAAKQPKLVFDVNLNKEKIYNEFGFFSNTTSLLSFKYDGIYSHTPGEIVCPTSNLLNFEDIDFEEKLLESVDFTVISENIKNSSLPAFVKNLANELIEYFNYFY